jgi:hypothetical protein
VDVRPRRNILKGTGMIEPDANREEIAAFLASLKKLCDGLDDFDCQLAAIDGAGMRLGLLCEETAGACRPGAAAMVNPLTTLAQGLRSFGGAIHCLIWLPSAP